MFIAGFMSAIFLPLKKEQVEKKTSAILYSFYLLDIRSVGTKTIDSDEARKRFATPLSR
jgi:hypothetical protein